MTTQELLSRLVKLDIKLWVDGKRLLIYASHRDRYREN